MTNKLNLSVLLHTLLFFSTVLSFFWEISTEASVRKISSESVEERIVQLERIYDAHSQFLTQLQQQLSESQTDIEVLRGQIQESQYHLNQLLESQKHVSLQNHSLRDDNNLKVILDKQNSSTSSIQKKDTDAVVTNVKSENVSTQEDKDINFEYNAASALAQDESHLDDAIAAFQRFVKKYPNSAYQSNANYWLGQLNYNKGKKDNAAYYFAFVVRNYPESIFSSDAMYKIGLILQEQGEIEKAKAIYQQVINKYHGTESAKQAKNHLMMMEQLIHK